MSIQVESPLRDGGVADDARVAQWAALAAQLRADIVRACAAAGSGHPTSSLSCADLIAVLVADVLRYDLTAPQRADNDALVFSKGHASALLYAVHKAVGAIGDEELLTYRRFGSRLEGHPRPVLPLIDVATGSLGQGLPAAVGIALAAARLAQVDAKTFVLCGDGEMGEGSMWEAMGHASAYGLDNLVAIVDVNGLAQDGPVFGAVDAGGLCERAHAFGWSTLEIDGHDLAEIAAAYATACTTAGRPTLIAARTVKGRGVAEAEGRADLHGKRLAPAGAELAGGEAPAPVRIALAPPAGAAPGQIDARQTDVSPAGVASPQAEAPSAAASGLAPRPAYAVGDVVHLRRAYGEMVAWMLERDARTVVLDAGVWTSTFGGAAPSARRRFIPIDIAEQQLVAAAVGLQSRGWRPYVSTFAAFLGRAADFVRMAAVGDADLVVCGSHGGVSVGEDGPSQMGLEDVAIMRSVGGSTVLCPCDANQTVALIEATAGTAGVRYLRTTRPPLPVIYEAGRAFRPGGSALVRSSGDDAALIVAAGITVHASLAAAEELAAEGIAVRVLDAYSLKPLDAAGVTANARACGGRVVTVEDHRPEGGLGEAVGTCLVEHALDCRMESLAVREIPGSGTGPELARAAGIDANAVVTAVRRVLAAPRRA
ncbi:MAG TPA: transketolase [Conexibacter sp.]|nr:transketolase [Conexibacter sp.]